jgi:hypothetical protein
MSFTSCSSRLGGAMFVLALEAKGGNMGIPWPCWKRQPLFSAPPTPTASNLTKSVSTRRYFVNIAICFGCTWDLSEVSWQWEEARLGNKLTRRTTNL